MGKQALDLTQLFRLAQQAMVDNRQEINDLDGYNGNHGDNMVENLKMITDALQSRQDRSPAEALQYASEKLAEQGRGGTSKYYTQGLRQAADSVKGHSSLDEGDIVTVVETLLGSIPTQGYPQKQEASESVLDTVMNLAMAKQPQAQPEDNGLDMGDLLERLIPAGLAFLQARQSGADSSKAAQQALLRALMGGTVQPRQAKTSRGAAGSLIAQTMLQALMGRK